MFRRIATAKAGKDQPAVLIELSNGDKAEIGHADLATHNTPAKLRIEDERQVKYSLTNVYFHLNRDGSIAVAAGVAPKVWPEDEPDL